MRAHAELARCASTSTCRCRRARRGSSRRCAGRTPRALPRPRRADPRARPRRRADDGRHRRFPRRDRGGLPGDARRRRAGRLRRRVHVRLLAAARDRGGDADRGARATRRRSSAWSGSSRSSSGARASERSASSGGRRRPRRGSVADRPGPAARPLAPQQGVNFAGSRSPARSWRCGSPRATSQTLAGEMSLVARALGADALTRSRGRLRPDVVLRREALGDLRARRGAG